MKKQICHLSACVRISNFKLGERIKFTSFCKDEIFDRAVCDRHSQMIELKRHFKINQSTESNDGLYA